MAATFTLAELQVRSIWARAVSPTHERILRRVGAHQVLTLARETGVRVAHLIAGRGPDRMQVDEDFTVIKARPPRDGGGPATEPFRTLSRSRQVRRALNGVGRGRCRVP
ncbi:hypothetical protein [Streptosporangium roseum]|uniref:hypothetical protein n=1 Tax=Streptosporangium roseum TaxID=2001 RepID=UPI0033282CC1